MAATSANSETVQILHGEHAVQVYYEDTDFTGYVYHANYLKFCERAREHLLGVQRLKENFLSGHHFVVRRMHIEFLQPAVHGDALIVRSSVPVTASPRWSIRQEIFRTGTTEIHLFTAEVEIVHVNRAGKPARVRAEFLQRLTAGA
jgi:acyl-CoA thioester hydrolase